MPKQKTRKSVSKRFRITKTGKVLRRKSFRGHLNVKKSSKRLRRLSKTVELKGHFAKKVKKILGVKKYGKGKKSKNKKT